MACRRGIHGRMRKRLGGGDAGTSIYHHTSAGATYGLRYATTACQSALPPMSPWHVEASMPPQLFETPLPSNQPTFTRPAQGTSSVGQEGVECQGGGHRKPATTTSNQCSKCIIKANNFSPRGLGVHNLGFLDRLCLFPLLTVM